MSRHALAASAFLALLGCSAFAASPDVEAAIHTIAGLEADTTGKLDGYCTLIKEMTTASEDEAKFDELEKQMRELLKSFGPQFEQVLSLSESTDPESEDGEALSDAFDRLDEKCAN